VEVGDGLRRERPAAPAADDKEASVERFEVRGAEPADPKDYRRVKRYGAEFQKRRTVLE